MAKPKFKQCDRLIRKGSEHVKCGTLMVNDGDFGSFYCNNRENHLMPFVTGWCHQGKHEGTRPKDGNCPVQTCHWIVKCPCQCHDEVAQMFEIADMPRIWVDNPEFIPQKSPYWSPSEAEIHALDVPSIVIRPDIHPDLERLALDVGMPSYAVAPAAARVFNPTTSGRTAKGELESWVKKVCDMWLMGDIENREALTPPRVSRVIAQEEDVKPPSTGAIDAVWKRWTAYGFATIEKKPTRFVGYTEDGLKFGLDQLRARYKRGGKVAAAAAARSFGSRR